MDKKIGLASVFAFIKASSPQGYQSTGLWACCSKYGDFSLLRRLAVLTGVFKVYPSAISFVLQLVSTLSWVEILPEGHVFNDGNKRMG